MRLTVLRGQPDAVELAALTAVLCAALRSAREDDGATSGPAHPPGAPWAGPRRTRPGVGWAARR
ncbi:acyl-CoA carboxylase subunit epsilon [Streptomyces sp. NPDC006879]|uniref:acyl-CoA carboxylase subunit epsilon n=1 Tax=Streptomyces sp. NPDC006879 TaxID=3364767 RepID=UPI0036CD7DFF